MPDYVIIEPYQSEWPLLFQGGTRKSENSHPCKKRGKLVPVIRSPFSGLYALPSGRLRGICRFENSFGQTTWG